MGGHVEWVMCRVRTGPLFLEAFMKLLPNHWWNNRFFPDDTPLDTAKRKLREWLYKFRIDLCWDENDGFDIGAFCGKWKRARGPFMFHQQMECECPHCYGPWRLMIALSPKAYVGFDDSIGK